MTDANNAAPYTLYHAKGACSLAVRIALEEAQAPYALVWVDFSAAQQSSPEFLALNPKGRVPLLITPAGSISETPALLDFVAQQFPAAQLSPSSPFGRAKMQELNSYLASTVHVAHAHRLRGKRWADEESAHQAMARKVSANMRECFAYLESAYLQGPWVLGEAYSVSDAYLFTMAQWLKNDGVDVAEFPKVLAHQQRMLQRPAVARAMAA